MDFKEENREIEKKKSKAIIGSFYNLHKNYLLISGCHPSQSSGASPPLDFIKLIR